MASLIWELPEWCSPQSIFLSRLTWLPRHPSPSRRAIRSAATAFQEKKDQGAAADRSALAAGIAGRQHLVNHGTSHRGQVMKMLRQLGVKPIATNLVVFYQERAD